MSNRRRNLFILAFVALLMIGSGIVIATKKTTLGLDLQGGTELIFQARPTPQNPTIDGSDIDRAIEIIRERTDAFGVSEPEISRIGSDSIRVGLPDVSNAARASDEVGQTAQLQLYDWEPNIIPNPAKTNVSRSESSFSRLYDAVQLASQQQPNCFENKCTTSGPQYYLFNSQTHAWIAGPTDTQNDLFAQLPRPEAAAQLRDHRGAARHRRRGEGGGGRGPGPRQPERSERRVVRDPGPTGALGHRHQGPEGELRPVRPAQRHLQLHRPGARGVREHHQGDRPARTAERPARRRRELPARRPVLRALRDRARRADQVPADHQLRREPERDRRPERRRDQRAEPAGVAGPRARSSRSARCRWISRRSRALRSRPPSARRHSTRD